MEERYQLLNKVKRESGKHGYNGALWLVSDLENNHFLQENSIHKSKLESVGIRAI